MQSISLSNACHFQVTAYPVHAPQTDHDVNVHLSDKLDFDRVGLSTSDISDASSMFRWHLLGETTVVIFASN